AQAAQTAILSAPMLMSTAQTIQARSHCLEFEYLTMGNYKAQLEFSVWIIQNGMRRHKVFFTHEIAQEWTLEEIPIYIKPGYLLEVRVSNKDASNPAFFALNFLRLKLQCKNKYHNPEPVVIDDLRYDFVAA